MTTINPSNTISKRLLFLCLIFVPLFSGCGKSGGDKGNNGASQNNTNSTPVSSILTLTADIPAFIADASTTLTATVFVPSKGKNSKTSTASSSPLHVSLERLNAEGVVISKLGDLHDDGLNGDTTTGDGVFSIQTTFQEHGSEPVRLRVMAVSDPSLSPTTSKTLIIPVYQIPSINTPSDYNQVVNNLFVNLVTFKDTFVKVNSLLSDSQPSASNHKEIDTLLETLTDKSMLAYTNVVALKKFGHDQTITSLKTGHNKPRSSFGWLKDGICAIPFLGAGCTISDIGQVGEDAINLGEIVRKNGADPRVPPGVRNCLLQVMSEEELSDPDPLLESMRGATLLHCPKGSGGFLDTMGDMAKIGTKFEIGQAFSPVTNAVGGIITTTIEGGKIAVQTGVNYISGKVIDWFVDDSGEEKIRVSEISSPTPTIDVPKGTHHLIVSYGDDTAPSIVPNVAVSQGISTQISAPPARGTTFTPPPPPALKDIWTPITAMDAPTARVYHSAVWTGSKMIVWGGLDQSASDTFNTGGIYDPVTDRWSAMTTTNAPIAMYGHTAIWTGSKMLVWGSTSSRPLEDIGGVYDPEIDSWSAITTTNAPTAIYGSTAVWTGSKMLIWGGGTNSDVWEYDPEANRWTTITTTGAPTARDGHTAVWTSSKMIVWGGYSPRGASYKLSTGGVYNPVANIWSTITTTNAPEARAAHKAVWTGSKMLIWGGNGEGCHCNIFNTGGGYDPGVDSWSTITTTNAPVARYGHTAIWTGSKMIIWGGHQQYYTEINVSNTGGVYNPEVDSWSTITTTNAPISRSAHTAVWTGSKMIVWGGFTHSDGSFSRLNTGAIYE